MQLTQNEFLTAGIAIFAVMLSALALVTQLLEKRNKVKVNLSLGFMALSRAETIDIITIDAVNCGRIPVHLSECVIRLPNTKEKIVAVFRYNRDFPITLNPGENIQAFWPSEKFVEAARKNNLPNKLNLVGEFSNKSGQSFRSKPSMVNITDLLFAKNNATKVRD